jgi:hypothetical protein
VDAPLARFSPSRRYLTAGLSALGLAAFSASLAQGWLPALLPSVLFTLSAAALIFLALRPSIEIYESELVLGDRRIPWGDIQRLDRTGWISPLLVHITLTGNRRILLIFPGDLESANSLLRHLRRSAREALIDGIPYRQFWGEALPAAPDRKQLVSPRYRMLREEDEAEVERMFQKLKTVGHLDKPTDEK